MANNSGTYTYYAQFGEYVDLFRGVTRVWIADGTAEKPGTAGALYAMYNDEQVQELGFVSDYNEAKEYFAELGISLTYAQWIEILANTPTNADTASRKAQEANNSSVSAASSASKAATSESNAAASKGAAETAKQNAQSAATMAARWATGSVLGSPSETNNSQYYSEQAQQYKEQSGRYSEDAGRSALTADARARDAEGWATGSTGGSYSPTNNAKYYSDRAAELIQNIATKAEIDNLFS